MNDQKKYVYIKKTPKKCLLLFFFSIILLILFSFMVYGLLLSTKGNKTKIFCLNNKKKELIMQLTELERNTRSQLKYLSKKQHLKNTKVSVFEKEDEEFLHFMNRKDSICRVECQIPN